MKQQSELTFNGFHKSCLNYDIYAFKQKEIVMDRPNFLGFVILELTKLIIYETYYDKLQPCFRQKKLQLHYMDTDSFVLNVNTKDVFEDLKSLEDLFYFSILNENHELFSNKNKMINW